MEQAHIRGGRGPVHFKFGQIPLHAYLEKYAELSPNKTAVNFYGREMTYGELNSLVDRFANFLNSIGVRKGDRVALYLQSCPQYIISFYAAQKIGAIVGPCSPMFKEWELEYEVSDMGTETIITLDELYPIVHKVRETTNLKNVIITNYQDFLPEQPTIPLIPEMQVPKKRFPETYDFLEEISKHEAKAPAVDINMDDVSLLVFTSGTTGMPKGAMLTYNNALFKVAVTAQTFQYSETDIFVSTQPLFHIAGMVLSMHSQIYTGATSVLITRFDPETIITAIEKYKCTKWYSTALMNWIILNHPDVSSRNLSSLSLNTCSSFGIALTEQLANDWSNLTKGCPLVETAYGLSETHTMDALMPLDQPKFGCTGKPLFEGMEIKIVDSDSLETKLVEELGEILVRNPGVCKGYWNKPEATAACILPDGWLRTGDMGKVDEEGYLYFLGRSKEMIKSSGYSVFPEEVEVLLLRHPAIAQVAVIGVPDDYKGEVVKAVCVLKQEYKEKTTEGDIVEWAKDKMAAYKRPRFVEFREALPTGGTGKVLRRALKSD